MRRAPIVLAALLGLASPAASQGTGEPTPCPRGSAAIRASIRVVQARLDALVAMAKADPRLEFVRIYTAYAAEQLKEPRRAVTVDKLLDVVVDTTASVEAREAAAAAITSTTAKTQDPDLSTEGKGTRRPRAQFSEKVVKHLDDDDVTTRGLCERILESLWPQANAAPILQFNPRKEKTFKPAIKSWQELLRK